MPFARKRSVSGMMLVTQSCVVDAAATLSQRQKHVAAATLSHNKHQQA